MIAAVDELSLKVKAKAVVGLNEVPHHEDMGEWIVNPALLTSVLDGVTQLQTQPATLSVKKELFGTHYASCAGLDAVEKRNL